jgi:hypothetical protein
VVPKARHAVLVEYLDFRALHGCEDYRVRGTEVPEEASRKANNRIAIMAQTVTQIVCPAVSAPLAGARVLHVL